MQKLYVESRLPVSPEEAWDVFESDEFRERLWTQSGTKSEVISERMDGAVEVRKLKFTLARELPGMVAKALGAKHLAYEQENHFDKSRSRLDWTVVLPMLGDRVKVEGVTTIEPNGENTSRRIVDGTIEVNMRLIGGQVEKAVVGEFEKSMRQAVDLALQMMKERESRA